MGAIRKKLINKEALECPDKFNPHAVLALDSKIRVVFYNTKAQDILKKLNVKNNFKAFLPKDIKQIVEKLTEGSGKLIRREVHIKNLIFVELIFFDKESNLIMLYLDDITLRKKTEELLEFNKAAVDSARDGIVLLDEKGKIVYANAALAKMTKYSLEEILTMEIFDIDAYFSRSDWKGHQEKKRESGNLFFETFYRRKDGTIYPVEISSNYLNYNGKEYNYAIIRDITERRKMEKDLMDKKRQYKELVEFLPQAVFEVNNDGIVTFANQTAVEYFGFTKEDIKKKINVLDLVIPEDYERAKNNLKKAILKKREENEGYEYTAVKRNGTTFPAVVYTSRIIKNRKVVGIRGIALDITENKKVENKLKESEERYRKIFENSTEGIFQTTLEGRYINVNPAFAKMFGFVSPNEMIKKITNIGEQMYVNPKDRERLKILLSKNNSVENFETELYKKNKNKIWISINCHLVKDNDGKVLYIEGTNWDVTKRKEMEEALKKGEERYRSLIENIKDIVYSIDEKGVFTYINNVAKSISGYSPKEIIGKHFSSFIHPDDLSVVEEMFKKRSGSPYEVRIITKKGETRWIENHSGAFPEKTNKKEVMGIITDITDRKEAEDRLVESYKHLIF